MNQLGSVDTSAIVTALNGVATNAQTVINDVAPIGVGILGIFLVYLHLLVQHHLLQFVH